jgi:glycosyltransferase involved in cell wall biosynthesis
VSVPPISVCIPLYCKEKFIGETIESVLNQTFTDFELIVLNNASTDKSGDIARSFDDPRLTVLDNPVTVDPIANHAKVVALSQAPLVKLLNADDLIHPACLERQIAVLERDSSLAMVTCRQNMIDEYGQVIARDCGLRQRDLVGTQGRVAIVRRLVRHGGNPVGNFNNVLFRRSAFDAAGGFPDNNFFALDVLTWVRLLEHGRYYGMPETLTSFRINSGSHTTELGGEAISIQRSFVDDLRRDNTDVVRLSDTLFGALRAPLTRLRHHMIFAAGGPMHSTYRQLATRLLGLRRSPHQFVKSDGDRD